MTQLKRIPVKWVRDFIKKDYKARDFCFVCGATGNLELHHIYSLSELFNEWCDSKGITEIKTQAEILTYRVEFAEDYADKLSNDNLYTLCSIHHKQLHNIYGQRYSNSLVPKIKNWLNIQKEKHGTVK